MSHALGPLAPLAAYRQFIPVKLVPLANGKTQKLPVDYRTGQVHDAHDPAIWTDYATAAALPGHGVGFVLTAAAGFWCIDIDNALQADDTWSALALTLCESLSGTVAELSQSGRGLHLWGRGPIPPHRSKNTALSIEAYSDRRFILLGTRQTGTLATACTGIAGVVARYFAPDPIGAADVPDDGPAPEWRGPSDDQELIALARRARTAAGAFGDSVTFADLYDGNAAALARRWPASGRADGLPFDASSADAALASHLAYYTGKDQARIDRLMRASALSRGKYERGDYLPRTIAGACTRCHAVLQRDLGPAAADSGASLATDLGRFRSILPDTPLNTARVFIAERYPGDSLRCWQGSYYRWQSGAWCGATGADVHAAVYAFLEQRDLSFYPPNQSNVGKVLDALKAAAHLDSAVNPPAWLHSDGGPPPGELVACANGLLHLPTGTLLPATPRLFNLNALPVPYSPAAPAPVAWLAFLSQVWPDDPEAVATLQELFGYLLTPDTSQQKIFLIVGPKRSGKGTMARVLTALLGSANVASPTLGSLAESFGLQPLVGKLAAVVSDARLSGRTDQQAVAENLLRISGEDQVEVNRKFLAPLAVRLGVRFVLLTNELPKIADASGAMASRFVILKMSESFIGREDPGLTARLLPELPGILAWAVEGWYRLHRRGYFAPPKSSIAAAQELADLGSPVGAFVRDVCTVAPGAEVAVDDLYSAWVAWCARQGIERAGTKPQFCRDLNAAQAGIKRRQPRIEGDRVPVYAGIGLRTGTGGTGWHGQPSIAAF